MNIPFAFIYTKSAPWGASEGLLLGCTQGGAILLNRYEAGVGKPYLDLLHILEGRDHFVLTTNVDHQFQLAGFDKARLFYTQGDYGLFQCSRNCFGETYDNERQVREMAELQKDQRVPSELVPRCPRCGAPMVPNLRIDGSFCEDRGWHEAAARYRAFCEAHSGDRILYLELGVGDNTPVIIKYPFWKAVTQNGRAARRGFSPEHSAGRKEAPQREARCGASLHVRGRSGEKPRRALRIPGGSSRPCRP